MQTYKIIIRQKAEKELFKLHPDTAKRIDTAITKLAHDPRPAGCKKLEGQDDAWRIRVGNYRIIYTINDNNIMIEIIRIRHRKDVYKH